MTQGMSVGLLIVTSIVSGVGVIAFACWCMKIYYGIARSRVRIEIARERQRERLDQ